MIVSQRSFGTLEGVAPIRSAGLRRYLVAVYRLMAAGLVVSAASAVLVALNPILFGVLFGPVGLTLSGWIVMILPFGLAALLGARAQVMSYEAARALFFLYATLVGASLACILVYFDGRSLAQAFVASAVGFGALAIAGTRTRHDLGGLASFLIAGVFGLVAAMLLNLVLRSSTTDHILSAIGVLLFAALSVTDAQRLRKIYEESDETIPARHLVVTGALTLYLDLLNVFLSILRLFGRHR